MKLRTRTALNKRNRSVTITATISGLRFRRRLDGQISAVNLSRLLNVQLELEPGVIIRPTVSVKIETKPLPFTEVDKVLARVKNKREYAGHPTVKSKGSDSGKSGEDFRDDVERAGSEDR